MAAKYNFRPAGLSDDESSDDDFSFNAPPVSRQYNPPTNTNGKDHFAERQAPPETGQGADILLSPRSPDLGKSRKVIGRERKRPGTVPAGNMAASMPVDDYRVAAMRGNQTAIQEFLNQGTPVDVIFPRSGWTALMYAASGAYEEIVSLLLKQGANPNFHKDMRSVLMVACSSTCENEEAVLGCVSHLINNGAEVNAMDRTHMTALMFAALEGRVLVAEKLLQHRADVNAVSSRGETALSLAAKKGQGRMVSFLLENEAEPGTRDRDGCTAGDIADAGGHIQVAEMLHKAHYGPGSQATEEEEGARSNADSSLVQNNGIHQSQAVQNNGMQWGNAAVHQSQASLPPVSRMRAERKPRAEMEPEIPAKPKVQSPQNTSQLIPHSVVKYGDLELFLCGLDLGHLCPTFQSHAVPFEVFLRFTDDDLIKMGVNQIGARKKILDALKDVHKKEWATTSLTSLQYNTRVTCAEAVAMVANISKHTAYIGSSIGYIRDQIRLHPELLLVKQGVTNVEDLALHTDSSMDNIKVLFQELTLLRRKLAKVLDEGEYKSPDLIVHRSGKGRRRRVRAAAVIVGAAILAGLLWKRDIVMDSLNKLLEKDIS